MGSVSDAAGEKGLEEEGAGHDLKDVHLEVHRQLALLCKPEDDAGGALQPPPLIELLLRLEQEVVRVLGGAEGQGFEALGHGSLLHLLYDCRDEAEVAQVFAARQGTAAGAWAGALTACARRLMAACGREAGGEAVSRYLCGAFPEEVGVAVGEEQESSTVDEAMLLLPLEAVPGVLTTPSLSTGQDVGRPRPAVDVVDPRTGALQGAILDGEDDEGYGGLLSRAVEAVLRTPVLRCISTEWEEEAASLGPLRRFLYALAATPLTAFRQGSLLRLVDAVRVLEVPRTPPSFLRLPHVPSVEALRAALSPSARAEEVVGAVIALLAQTRSEIEPVRDVIISRLRTMAGGEEAAASWVLRCLMVVPLPLRTVIGHGVFIEALVTVTPTGHTLLTSKAREVKEMAVLVEIGEAVGIEAWQRLRHAPVPLTGTTASSLVSTSHPPPIMSAPTPIRQFATAVPRPAKGEGGGGECGDGISSYEQANQHLQSIRDMYVMDGETQTRTAGLREVAAGGLYVVGNELYSQAVHFLPEIIQNVEDNRYRAGIVPELDISLVSGDVLRFEFNEVGFTKENVTAICKVNDSTKPRNREGGYIGHKGIGFKSLFKVRHTAFCALLDATALAAGSCICKL